MEVVYVLLAIFIVFLLAKPKRKAEIVKPRSESDKVYDNPTKEFKKASLKAVYETESVHVSDSNSAGSYKEQKEANLREMSLRVALKLSDIIKKHPRQFETIARVTVTKGL